MSKALLWVGYHHYVVDVDVAAKLTGALADAEIYAERWHEAQEGKESHSTYHVYRAKHDVKQGVTIISDEHYRLAKMAGEPEKE